MAWSSLWYVELQRNINTNKLTFASISEVIQLPRETVRRKVISLSKKNILTFNTYGGVKLGPSYQTIYKWTFHSLIYI